MAAPVYFQIPDFDHEPIQPPTVPTPDQDPSSGPDATTPPGQVTGSTRSQTPELAGSPIQLSNRATFHRTNTDQSTHSIAPSQRTDTTVRRTSTHDSQDSRRHSLLTYKDRLRNSLTPSQHYLLNPFSPSSTAAGPSTIRDYSKIRQRHRLWRLTIGEFALTVLLSLSYFIILYKYAQRTTISVPQRRIFNALTTGNSLLLGVNLAASLRSYAKMLRWRMLAARFRPLETFDLVMGCDSLMNVMKLLWRGGRKGRHWWWPSRTQVYAALWLLVNLGLTLLVGMIGLTYNLDVSRTFVLIRTGEIEIADLSMVLKDDYLENLSSLQNWGLAGWGFDELSTTNPNDEYLGSYFGLYNGTTWYYFNDVSANSIETVLSFRFVQSTAFCSGYEVVEGNFGNLTYVVYLDGEEKVNQTTHVEPGPAGLLAIANTNSTCGSRCTNIKAFQAQANPAKNLEDGAATTIDQARFFICNNTLSSVYALDFNPGDVYQFPDLQARMIAGAIGWSGSPLPNDTQQYTPYLNSSQVQFYSTPNAVNMAAMISEFTMGAIAAMDILPPGVGRKTVEEGQQPISAQVLNVEWKYAAALLALLPFLHFWTLMAVIIWANKAIIKDDSHLGAAKVYHSLLSKLGDGGCMLRGDEIVRQLKNPMVAYGWMPGETDGQPGHTDVYEVGSGMNLKRAFEEGKYDGMGGGTRRRRRYSFDR